MAKEKKISAGVVDSLMSKYGDIFSSGEDIMNEERQIIPVSPNMDEGLSGGIPVGSFVTIAGPNACGKSTMCLQIIKNSLDILYKGKKRKVYYLDVEHRLRRKNLSGIRGLNPEDVTVIKSTEKRILTGEDFCDIAEALVKDPENKGAVIVVDSTSKLCPSSEMEKETSATIRASTPKLLAHFLNKVCAAVPVMDIILLTIQHTITNTSGYGEAVIVDGGEKLRFAADIRMQTKGKPEMITEGDNPVGQITDWTITKSALGAPYIPTKTYIKFGTGLDMIRENIGMATKLGVLNKGGAWYSYGDKKWQGEANLAKALESDPELYSEIVKRVREMAFGE